MKPSPTLSQSVRACARHASSASCAALLVGRQLDEPAPRGHRDERRRLVEADVQVERSRRHLRVHAATVGMQLVGLLDQPLGARRVAAVLRELVPRARHAAGAAPARDPLDVVELTVDVLDPGQELEHPCAARRAAEHVDQRDELVGVGGAARHRVRVPVGVDEGRRQAERTRAPATRRAPPRGAPARRASRRGPRRRRPSRRRAGWSGRRARRC